MSNAKWCPGQNRFYGVGLLLLVADNVGLNVRQLHSIPVEKCAKVQSRLAVLHGSILYQRSHWYYLILEPFFSSKIAGEKVFLEIPVMQLFMLTSLLFSGSGRLSLDAWLILRTRQTLRTWICPVDKMPDRLNCQNIQFNRLGSKANEEPGVLKPKITQSRMIIGTTT